MQLSKTFNNWPLKMAWRDSRTHRKRLFLFMTSIILGVAALVSIGSFGQNLESAIDENAKTLLGADLLLKSLQPIDAEIEAVMDSIAGKKAREILFISMAYFPKSQSTRLVQVRAVKGDFPFYGEIGTIPKTAAAAYKSGPFALVDDVLMAQFGVQPGDSIRLGAQTFAILGRLTKLPSEPPIASTFNPRVYIPYPYLEQTHLLQRGSLVNYRLYYQFEAGTEVAAVLESIEPKLREHRVRYDTVAERQKSFKEILGALTRFLNLVGFVAILLGGVGVASSVHVYVRQKMTSVATLRCLGAKARQPFQIFTIQVTLMALLGSVIGALIGMLIQIFIPQIFMDLIPVEIATGISWGAVFKGIGLGVGLALLFAMLPLVSIRHVSPLLALRADYEPASRKRDKLQWLLVGVLLLAIGAIAVSEMESTLIGVGFVGTLLVVFGILAALARLLMFLSRRFFPKSWPYVWRQGMANLFRPNNQTLVLMLAIGLGTFLISTLYLSHGLLLNKVAFAGGGDRPNLIMFDIQPDQRDGLRELVKQSGLPILQEAPIITMRLEKLQGQAVADILADSTRALDENMLLWEYRATYRDSLLDSETIVAGEWVYDYDNLAAVIPISMEDGAAERLELALGDTIVWDVQGVPVTTRIASLRKVDWQRVQANFFIVFPENVLESAPQIFVLATKAATTQQSADIQRKVVQSFPNISLIDLALILGTIDTFLSKISFAVRFMAFFSILTGLVVLTAAVVTSRFQRIQESVLLRTMGASGRQVMQIILIEYAFLGSLAALTGLSLSYLATWILGLTVFESVFVPTMTPFMIILLSVAGLTMLIGVVNSRGILDKPPLEILRAET